MIVIENPAPIYDDHSGAPCKSIRAQVRIPLSETPTRCPIDTKTLPFEAAPKIWSRRFGASDSTNVRSAVGLVGDVLMRLLTQPMCQITGQEAQIVL